MGSAVANSFRPGTFTHVPLHFSDAMDAVRTQGGNWHIRCPLWTLEAGRSDLELQVTAREVFDGIWEIEIDDVLVP